MAGSVNKVIILGNLGADPEVREFPSGAKYCRFGVATSERWNDRNTGESREKTEWHNVTVYAENLVRISEQYLNRGDKVYIEGKLETRKWQDQEGRDRYTTEVAVRPYGGQICLLGNRSSGSSQSDSRQSGSPYDGGGRKAIVDTAPTSRESTTGSNLSNDIDDDIPF